jgi:hypothetical protein
MSEETGIGAVIGLTILAFLLVPIWSRAFGKDDYNQRWGRYEYQVRYGDRLIAHGSSFRKENPKRLDEIAGHLLNEWFYSEEGATMLVHDSNRERYHCVCFLAGYGAGEARG